ncbi:MAG: hypothetical protein IKO98_09470 [Bacteroidales bacterium]|nr:hypothetical protein [Bacteroidales bacterium]
MNNIMDFWRNEWAVVADTSEVTGIQDIVDSKEILGESEIKGGWYKDENNDIKWTECKNSKEWSASKIEGDFLGSAVVNINGSLNETLGTKQKGDTGYDGRHTNGYIDGKDAITAEVMVYGPHGENDVKTYIGFTMSSNSEKFGVVANGIYSVNRLSENERKGPYESDLVVESRSARIPALNNYNPAYPDRSPGYLTGVFLHRCNRSGWMGTFYENGKIKGVSEGCLIIDPSHWHSFCEQISSVNSFKLILSRS